MNYINEEKKTKNMHYIVYWMIYSAMACFFPFLPHYLGNRGLSYVEIGFCFSLTSIVSIISQPFWGYVSDRWLGRRRTILTLLVACGFSALTLIFTQSFSSIALGIILVIFFQGALFPLFDSNVYGLNEIAPSIQYGKVRLFGSAGFAVAAFILGILLKYYDEKYLFLLYCLLMLIALPFFLLGPLRSKQSVERPHFKDVHEILKSPRFLFIILSVCVSSIACISNGNYIAILVEKTGGTTASLGTLWLFVALSELPLFYIGSKLLLRFGENKLYICALVLYTLRFFASAFCTSFIPVMIIQLMQAFTFPTFMLATTSKANRLLPDNLRATGMTLMTSLGFGLGGLIGNLSGGYVVKYFSVFILYHLYGVITIIGLLIFLYSLHREKKSILKTQSPI